MKKRYEIQTNIEPIAIDTKAFIGELEWVSRFIQKRSTIPVLQNVRFEKTGEFLHLTATDLETAGITSLEIAEAGADFALTAPVQLLLKYLKKVDDPSITLAPSYSVTPLYFGPHPEACLDGDCTCNLKQEVSDVKLTLTHGDGASVDVAGIAAAMYPDLPATPPAIMQLSGLETAIPRALIAVSKEESRFTLCGALLSVKGTEANLVSTDGHRLSLSSLTTYDVANVHALIPSKCLSELVRIGDGAFFGQDDNHVFFSVGQRTIMSRKLTGSFPDYERALPRELPYACDVSVTPLRKVLDRVSLFADERSHNVLFSVNGAFSVTAKSFDRGNASGKVPIDCVRRLESIDGPGLHVSGYVAIPGGLSTPYGCGFNAQYVAEFLKASDVSEVRFRFGSFKSAAEWNSPGWRYVVMPMRFDDGASEAIAADTIATPEIGVAA